MCIGSSISSLDVSSSVGCSYGKFRKKIARVYSTLSGVNTTASLILLSLPSAARRTARGGRFLKVTIFPCCPLRNLVEAEPRRGYLYSRPAFLAVPSGTSSRPANNPTNSM